MLNLSMLLLPLVVGLPMLFVFGGRLPTAWVVVALLALTVAMFIGGIRTATNKGRLVLAWYKCTCGIDAVADESQCAPCLSVDRADLRILRMADEVFSKRGLSFSHGL